MLRPIGTLVLVLILSYSLEGWARPTSDARKLTMLFKARFDKDYEERQCGRNIMRLLQKAQQQGINADNARMIHITNIGNSVFGMVNAERARGGYRASTGEQFPPGEVNWYFHVLLELDCLVFDFDFLNEPVVLSLHDYFELMFLDEVPPELPFYRVGREEKLKNYEIEVYRGRDIYANPRKPNMESKMRLEELLQTCPKQSY